MMAPCPACGKLITGQLLAPSDDPSAPTWVLWECPYCRVRGREKAAILKEVSELCSVADRIKALVVSFDQPTRGTTKPERKEGDADSQTKVLKLPSNDAGHAGRSPCSHDLDVSPSGKIAACKLCDFVGRWRDGVWERVVVAPPQPPQNPELGCGPFRVSEYIGLPGDRVYWAAVDHASGIMCSGRDTAALAESDAEALNAAYAKALKDAYAVGQQTRSAAEALLKICFEARDMLQVASASLYVDPSFQRNSVGGRCTQVREKINAALRSAAEAGIRGSAAMPQAPESSSWTNDKSPVRPYDGAFDASGGGA